MYRSPWKFQNACCHELLVAAQNPKFSKVFSKFWVQKISSKFHRNFIATDSGQRVGNGRFIRDIPQNREFHRSEISSKFHRNFIAHFFTFVKYFCNCSAPTWVQGSLCEAWGVVSATSLAKQCAKHECLWVSWLQWVAWQASGNSVGPQSCSSFTCLV